MNMSNWKILLCASLAVAMAFACGESGDHRDVQRAVSQSGENASDAIIEAMILLESSQMFNDYAAGGDCSGEFCGDTAPDSSELETEYEFLHDMMAEYVFTSDNIEESSSSEIVYLMRGEVICGEPDEMRPDAYDSCVEEVDELEIRLATTFEGNETVSIDILLGPDQIYVSTFTVGPDVLSMSVVLDNLEDAVDFLTDVAGEEMVEFPERLEGEVEFGYYADGDDHRVALSILDDLGIEVAGDFSLDAEAAGEVLAFGMNPEQETLSGTIAFGAFSAMGVDFGHGTEAVVPETEENWLTEPSDPVEYGLEFDEMTATVTFDPAAEQLTFDDVGLGGSPLVITIDGEEVITVDLNSSMGGAFDGLLQLKGDDLEFSVNPGFELIFGAFFHRVADSYDDYSDWMYDDVLSIVLDGADDPAVLITYDEFQVLRGQFSMQSETTDHGVTVSAGMCVEEEPYAGGSADDHPFMYLEEAQCTN